MNTDRNIENYFGNNIYNTIEIAELAEDIKCTSANLTSGVDGNFYIKLLTPTQETNTMRSKQLKDGSLLTNYLPIHIPAHLVFQFANVDIEELYIQNHIITDNNGKPITLLKADKEFTIPQGTKFLFAFYGGELEYDRIKIVGIY